VYTPYVLPAEPDNRYTSALLRKIHTFNCFASRTISAAPAQVEWNIIFAKGHHSRRTTPTEPKQQQKHSHHFMWNHECYVYKKVTFKEIQYVARSQWSRVAIINNKKV
jgi:hypothetical protein